MLFENVNKASDLGFTDDAELSFSEKEIFDAELSRINNAKVWLPVNVRDIEVLPSAEVIFSTLDGMWLYEDTARGSGIAVGLPDGFTYYLDINGVQSLRDRGGVKGTSGITALYQENCRQFVEYMNTFLRLKKNDKQALAVISNGKCRALLSESYARLDSSSLFRIMEEELGKLVEDYIFTQGYISQNIYAMQYVVTDMAAEEEYNRMLHRAGRPYANDIHLHVSFATSDTGCSGANISMRVTADDRTAFLANHICLEHKGGASLDDFRLNASRVLAVYRDSIADLESLANVTVRNPVPAIIKLMVKVGISQKLALETADQHRDLYGCEPCSGLDLYYSISECLQIAKICGVSPYKDLHKRRAATMAELLDLEEKLCSVLPLIANRLSLYDRLLQEGGRAA